MAHEGLLLFPAVVMQEAARWAGDLGSSVRTLFTGTTDFDEVGEQYDKQVALSQLITFAVLADGEVTEEEADNLRHLFETSDRFTGDAAAEVERLREAARRVQQPAHLENTIRVVASDLDREWKDDAFRFVAVLALRGSGLGKTEHGFRVAPVSDPDGLLGVFARALEVSEGVRDRAIESASSSTLA